MTKVPIPNLSLDRQKISYLTSALNQFAYKSEGVINPFDQQTNDVNAELQRLINSVISEFSLSETPISNINNLSSRAIYNTIDNIISEYNQSILNPYRDVNDPAIDLPRMAFNLNAKGNNVFQTGFIRDASKYSNTIEFTSPNGYSQSNGLLTLSKNSSQDLRLSELITDGYPISLIVVADGIGSGFNVDGIGICRISTNWIAFGYSADTSSFGVYTSGSGGQSLTTMTAPSSQTYCVMYRNAGNSTNVSYDNQNETFASQSFSGAAINFHIGSLLRPGIGIGYYDCNFRQVICLIGNYSPDDFYALAPQLLSYHSS